MNLSGAPRQPAGTLAVDTTAPTAVTNAAVNTATSNVVSTASTLAASGFGNNTTTLGYTGNTSTVSGNSSAADGTLASQMALFNQYAASSFAMPAPAIAALPQQTAWGSISQTLARPNG